MPESKDAKRQLLQVAGNLESGTFDSTGRGCGCGCGGGGRWATSVSRVAGAAGTAGAGGGHNGAFVASGGGWGAPTTVTSTGLFLYQYTPSWFDARIQGCEATAAAGGGESGIWNLRLYWSWLWLWLWLWRWWQMDNKTTSVSRVAWTTRQQVVKIAKNETRKNYSD